MADPADVLGVLAARLREEDTPISPHVVEPTDEAAEAAYGTFVLDSVREGYLLHYGEPRLLAGHDADLALLAGDYLYALGIERLAAQGDVEAVAALANLISTSAQLHTEGREDEVPGVWDRAVEEVSG